MKKKVYFRADAGLSIGYGHFIRSLALADMLKEDFNCTFFTQTPTEYQKKEAEMVCPLVALPADNTRFELFLKKLSGDEIVVLDNYFFTSEYQKEIKEKGCKLVCVDDVHDKHYYADVVVNHGLSEKSLFDIEPYTRLCLGFEYALLRKPFLTHVNINKVEGSWFISFGGTDYLNLTEKVLKLIHNDNRVKSISVVIGDAFQYKENLSSYPKAIIKENLTAEQMAQEMQKSQYAILPSSSVCIEALAGGCKVAAGYFVNNQQPYHDEWSKKSFILGLGNIGEKINNNTVNLLINSLKSHIYNFKNIPSNYIEVFKQL